ncbi:glycosyl transferase family 2 [Alicyclobacillus shizuokensis]|uniref:glycosyl transferase family 2 n=1 Tax=Alicyclobacillus shizuokensis TaxID=392014 RepID=UPI001FE2366D|nr:glycosyl transferase family 2 [Alicyclobacillus shizuokensis]
MKEQSIQIKMRRERNIVDNGIDQYQKITVDYDLLSTLDLPIAIPFVLTVNWNGVKFEFLIKINVNSPNLLVFSSGAMVTKVNLPYFQRHSWIYDFEDSMIYYNDPTLYLGDIPLGWGQGTWDRFYLKDIATILTKLIGKIGVNQQNVLFYGSSGGGFMSLILAGYIRDSTALVNCPQTCLTKWLEIPVQNVFNLSYPSLSIQEVLKVFPERINVIKFYNHIKYVPKIYYLQNAACEYDMTNHVIPFLSDLQFMEDGCVVNKVIVDLYYDKQPGPAILPALGGHGALGKYETINYINQVKAK